MLVNLNPQSLKKFRSDKKNTIELLLETIQKGIRAVIAG